MSSGVGIFQHVSTQMVDALHDYLKVFNIHYPFSRMKTDFIFVIYKANTIVT